MLPHRKATSYHLISSHHHPLILETSRQARFMIPMAISLGFGVLFATLITLILVPSFYLAVEDLRQLVGSREMISIDVANEIEQSS